MNTKQAKDFLAHQAAEQATLDKTSLSDIERRMMYFTESDPRSCDDPLALNDEFEAQCDTQEYEAKVSLLLQHAHQRLKAEGPEGKRTWDEAVRELRKGDHYVLVLLDAKLAADRPAGKRSKGDSLKLLGAGLMVAGGLVIAIVLAGKYNIDLDPHRGYGSIVFAVLFAVVFLLASGMAPGFYRALVAWFHRLTGKEP
jgi:hypothetical protein